VHRLALAMLLAVFVPSRAPQLSPFYFNLGIGHGFES